MCLDAEGDFIRQPNEILKEWTYEQVWDALEIKHVRGLMRKRAEAAAKAKRHR